MLLPVAVPAYRSARKNVGCVTQHGTLNLREVCRDKLPGPLGGHHERHTDNAAFRTGAGRNLQLHHDPERIRLL